MSELPDWAWPLGLIPHPEGGWFRETWRSDITISQAALPPGYSGVRSAGTATLFMLLPGQQSAWHTVRSPELWFYHRGSPMLLEIGREQSEAVTHVVGPDVSAFEQPQLRVPPGYWQRARPRDDEPSLVSCVVVPGFDFDDFAMATPTTPASAVRPARVPRNRRAIGIKGRK